MTPNASYKSVHLVTLSPCPQVSLPEDPVVADPPREPNSAVNILRERDQVTGVTQPAPLVGFTQPAPLVEFTVTEEGPARLTVLIDHVQLVHVLYCEGPR